MSTVSERRKEMYQKDIKWIKGAIADGQAMLNDQYENNLYCSAVEKQVEVPSADPKSSNVVKEADDFFSWLREEIAHDYAKYDISRWGIRLKI